MTEKIYTSVPEGAEGLVIKDIQQSSGENIIYIARDDKRMSSVAESLAFFAPETEVMIFPAWDCLPYDRISPHGSIMSQRLFTLSKISKRENKSKNKVLVTTINSVIQRVPPLEVISKVLLRVTKGDTISRQQLTEFLVTNGYVNTGKVDEPGEYAFRGSIVDIFPPGSEDAYRIDSFGDVIETIRVFDPLTQISGRHVNRLDLIPASEIFLDDASIELFRKNYREMFGGSGREDPLYEAVSEGRKYAGMEHWLPLFYERLDTIFDYLPDAGVITDNHAEEARSERIKHINDYYESRKDATAKAFNMGANYHPASPDLLYLQDGSWEKLKALREWTRFSPFSEGEESGSAHKQIKNLAAESRQTGKNIFEILKDKLANKKLSLIATFSQGSRERMKAILESNNLSGVYVNDWKDAQKLPSRTFGLVVFGLENGFESDAVQILSEQDILGERAQGSKRKQNLDPAKYLEEAANLSEGELVVHRQHGIGRFEGLETIDVLGAKHDCLKLVYAGDDRLFVPVENIDAISRYGSDAEGVELDRLGGLAWQKRTAKLRERITLTASELIEIAATRQIKNAETFESSSNGAYQEFCSHFPYAETDDQKRAIEDVEHDLSSGHPMDRLICGDVGFGKTEVALRAAFLVAHGDGESHGQVAVITPTTLLARQHYKEFKKRFKDFPIQVRQLSRMVSTSEARKVREELEEGRIDIIIGTHALLAKNVKFKKLSLLIVDEEQHFGVKQKEQLKRLRSDTHILTLTATPIPRTLQLSLTGVRDLSLIATPPVDRLAIRTYVMPFDSMVVREAILREHYRGGRTFYVCPRISDLDEVEKNLRSLIPEIKIAVGHGQMGAQHLDKIMNEFYEGVYDVLLSTTIIESGIDIPEANTLIIHRADMFGLAQLYQLRGRVGRSNVRAYAYLTIPPKRRPTRQAVKRLEVMQTLDTLGAGFTLATYDMDIRGFGNLLGDEQSGNIKEVGIELYQEMLKEAVVKLKSAEAGIDREEKEEFTPHINIGVSVLIPENYVSDLSLRLGLYRRIGNLNTAEEVQDISVELVDRFGALPEEVKNLFEVVKIKQICRKAGIEKLNLGSKGTVISFHKNQFKKPEALLNYLQKNPSLIKLKPDQSLVISHENWNSFEEKIRGISTSLQEVARLAA